MKQTAFFAYFLAIFAFFSCQNEQRPTAPPLTFTIQNQSWKGAGDPNVKLDTGAAAEVKVTWPVASGGTKQAVEGINGAVERWIAASLQTGEGEPLQKIGKAATEFISAFRAAKKANKNEFAWSAEIDGKPIFQSKKVASVELSAANFTGGAHGSQNVFLGSFDLVDGHRLSKTAVFSDTSAVVSMLAAAFAKAKNVADVKEVILPDVQFGFPENFAVTADGVRFHYNQYEVAAYALGPTEILLKWADLGKAADRSNFLD